LGVCGGGGGGGGGGAWGSNEKKSDVALAHPLSTKPSSKKATPNALPTFRIPPSQGWRQNKIKENTTMSKITRNPRQERIGKNKNGRKEKEKKKNKKPS